MNPSAYRFSIFRAFRGACLAGLVALALGPSAAAQISDTSETFETLGEGLKIGNFALYPSMAFEYAYDTNILFMSTDLPGSDPIASGVVLVRPRILLNRPLLDGRVRLLYAPFYRDYTNDRFKPEDRINHAFDFETVVHQDGPFTIGVRDHFMRGTVSLQEQSDRRGLPVGLGHYSIHSPQLELGLKLAGRHEFTLIPSYTRSSFEGLVNIFGQVSDYGYTTRRLEGRYGYRITEATTLYPFAAFESTTQTQTGIPHIDIQGRQVGMGVTRTVNDLLVTQVAAGYQTLTFEGGIGRDYAGPFVDTSAIIQGGEETRVELGLLREAFPSVFSNSNYYIDTEGRARVLRQIPHHSWLEGAVKLQDNQYIPAQGQRRHEQILRLEAGIGHRFVENLRGYVGYNYDRRISNVELVTGGDRVDPFLYTVHRFLFRLEVGWL
jgi:hypothetical protein